MQLLETARHPNEDAKVVQMARDEWVAVYGTERASGTDNRATHMHKGTPGPRKQQCHTTWIQKRRAHVASLVEHANQNAEHVSAEGVMAGWTDRHTKEAIFIEGKRIRNLFEGIREGNIEPDGLTADELRSVTAHAYDDAKSYMKLI